MMVHGGNARERAVVNDVLQRYGKAVTWFLEQSGTQIVLIGDHGKYTQHSGALRELGVNLDERQSPAGLYMISERTVYIRTATRFTCAHEIGHAIDHAIGGEDYRTSNDWKFQQMYKHGMVFVSEYAGKSIDEALAESLRSYVGVDVWSQIGLSPKKRLQTLNPDIFRWIEKRLAEIAVRYQARQPRALAA